LRGATAGSGASTPEPYAKACQRIQIWLDRALANSCRIHNLQSDFCLPVQRYIGEGKLGSRNAIQFQHALFSLYDELSAFKDGWNKIVRAVWRKVYGTEAGKLTINLPDDLLLAMQQPLITPWWMIRCLATLARRYLLFFFKMAKGVRNMTDTSNKESTVTVNDLFQMDHCQCSLSIGHHKFIL
jgi:hypothetical protein